MASVYNEQRRLGVRVVADGTTMFNGLPVIGISDAGSSLFSKNLRTLPVDILSADAAMYNDQPVRGVVQISDGRLIYNNALVLPSTTGGGVPALAWRMADGVTAWKISTGGYWLRSA